VKPVNRNLLVEIQKEEPKETHSSTFLLPEDYKRKTVERYSIVKVLQVANDCEKIRHTCRCVVETSMINEINIGNEVYNIIGENYVVLILGDE